MKVYTEAYSLELTNQLRNWVEKLRSQIPETSGKSGGNKRRVDRAKRKIKAKLSDTSRKRNRK